jgi:hypothetical protein
MDLQLNRARSSGEVDVPVGSTLRPSRQGKHHSSEAARVRRGDPDAAKKGTAKTPKQSGNPSRDAVERQPDETETAIATGEAARILFEINVRSESSAVSGTERATVDRPRIRGRVPMSTKRWKRMVVTPQEAAVEALLQKELGVELRHVETKEIGEAKQEKRDRRIFRLTFDFPATPGRTISVLTKTGVLHKREYVARKEAFLSSLAVAEFRAPKFYGLLDLGHGNKSGVIGVWEFVDGERPSVVAINQNLERIVRAAAAIAAVTQEALNRLPDLRTKNKYLSPKANLVREQLLKRTEAASDADEMLAKVERLAALENDALDQLASLPKFLSHSDLSGDNVFLPLEGPIVIFDWESASLAPMGACMRSIARRDELLQLQSAELFATSLRSKNIGVSYDDVLFGMRAVEIFRALWYGTDPSHPKARQNLHWALDHLDYLAAG